MKNQDFDRFVESTSTDDIVRHLRNLDLGNLADLVGKLFDTQEILENYALSDWHDLDEYLENSFYRSTTGSAIQDFINECNSKTAKNGQISRKKLDGIIEKHLEQFT